MIPLRHKSTCIFQFFPGRFFFQKIDRWPQFFKSISDAPWRKGNQETTFLNLSLYDPWWKSILKEEALQKKRKKGKEMR